MASWEKNVNLAAKESDLYFLYHIGLHLSWALLYIVAVFNPKIKKFVEGRRSVQAYLEKVIPKEQAVIWIHAASLGEYEQGLPVIEKLKNDYPGHFILITFFSPSGYEVRKNTKAADAVCYLPMDTKRNVERFLGTVRPVLAIFIKYEVWPNYLKSLQSRKVPVVLISAIFSRRQVYFKWYGRFMRKALRRFTKIFVQNEESQKLMHEIGIEDTVLSGDTRFDRVAVIREQGGKLDFMEAFKKDHHCFVAGSSWPEDEEIILNYIHNHHPELRTVIAPHDIKSDHIKQLQNKLKVPSVLFSELDGNSLDGVQVLIIDTIGLLTRIYQYADIAYVGGGFATGLHNTLEPAVFGIPVLIGPKYHNFQEAIDLVHRKGVLVVKGVSDFNRYMDQLLEDPDFCKNTGLINSDYITAKRGASIQITDYLRTLL
ncbi:MAG: glycosyltransferase N-terminal domain-containing protein [Flavobacteriaceae bacterium]